MADKDVRGLLEAFEPDVARPELELPGEDGTGTARTA